jgi:HK97 family phage prohead protease
VKVTDLLGAPERRHVAPMEMRAASDSELVLTGYASVFNHPYDVMGGAAAGGFSEVVDARAFDKTLAASPDLHLLINHEGMPLARTRSGTLALSTDKTGLRVHATLDRLDPDVQRLERKMLRGDMSEMSFAFRTIRDSWDHDDTERRLLEVSLDKGDVSVVNFGANPATSSEIQRALDTLVHADDSALAEIRGADLAAVQQAVGRALRPAPGEKPRLSLTQARQIAGLNPNPEGRN